MSSGRLYTTTGEAGRDTEERGWAKASGHTTIADRIAQTVVRGLLEPELELIFHKDSYGYWANKSTVEALSKARERCWELNWVIGLDIKEHFQGIPHEQLMKAVRRHCWSKWVLLYIERWLKAPLQKADGTIVERTKAGWVRSLALC